jgi:cardiolipin synthase
MTFIKRLFWVILSASVLTISSGCTLPNVSEKIDTAPAVPEPGQIVSARGLLSEEQSKAIIERLKRSVDPTDILERHIAVEESVTENPLTKGNKVTLLVDGPAAYAAMFKAIQAARDHINLETFLIDDDDVGREFSNLLLKKQAEGVQVNLIYDSVGSFTTPSAFFQRMREGGINVAEVIPINPL